MTVGSLFSGIGGFDLGFERAGFEIKWQVEIDPFCQRVLTKHWPKVKRYSDVRTLMRIDAVDVVCGGFPCQPHSLAGKRGGSADERDLWLDFARVICIVKPRWVVAENVPGLLSSESGRFFGGILRDLASIGYDAEWDCIPASAVGAPHRRDRVWLVAYPDSERRDGNNGVSSAEGFQAGNKPCDDVSAEGAVDRAAAAHVADTKGGTRQRPASWQGGHVALGCEDVADTQSERARPVSNGSRLEGQRIFTSGTRPQFSDLGDDGWWRVEPDVGRVAHGIPARVDRLRGLGNAIVPQIAEWIARRIIEAEATVNV